MQRALPKLACPLAKWPGLAPWLAVWVVVVGGPLTSLAESAEPAVSFHREVMAVLSKAGCNAGTCHGNQNGKGGFKLSLRGQDPADDYQALAREWGARRVNRADADASLLLLKPTMQVPHEGGRRFARDSQEYRLLRDWIAAGLPLDSPAAAKVARLDVAPREAIVAAETDSVALQVRATFAGGAEQDVTSLAVYEPVGTSIDPQHHGVVRRVAPGEATLLVRYLDQIVPVRITFLADRPDYVWSGPEPANEIDRQVFGKLQRLRVNPAVDAGDTLFLRRVCLDLLGVLPTADEARRFAADSDRDKRAKLVDQLLARPELATRWALAWADLLGVEEKTLDRKGVQNFHHWLRDAFERRRPWNEIARDILSARGSTYLEPPANFYRAHRDPTSRSEAVAQVFLGVRLQCARCHNHPFDRWTQHDYYSWAAVFAPVEYKIVENQRRDQNDKHEFDGEQIVWWKAGNKVKDPRTGERAKPHFLGAAQDAPSPWVDSIETMAAWLTSDENPYFATVLANRLWHQMFGRGLVDPIDDLRATNPASHPELLAYLASELARSGYDARHLVREIALSQTYQRSSEQEEALADEGNYSRAAIRRLSAEELLDAVCQVLEAEPKFEGYPHGLSAGELPGVQAVRPRDRRPSPADRFLKLFGRPPRLMACECERSDATTLGQALQLISGDLVNNLLTAPDNRLGRLMAQGQSDAQIIDELFWAALARPPSDEEQTAMTAQLAVASDRRAALEDIAWGVLNSQEFLLRR